MYDQAVSHSYRFALLPLADPRPDLAGADLTSAWLGSNNLPGSRKAAAMNEDRVKPNRYLIISFSPERIELRDGLHKHDSHRDSSAFGQAVLCPISPHPDSSRSNPQACHGQQQDQSQNGGIPIIASRHQASTEEECSERIFKCLVSPSSGVLGARPVSWKVGRMALIGSFFGKAAMYEVVR
jgi:hypothetical protein